MIIPVIMAGGAGTRLWPMSSEEKPKQFHNMSGGGTLLEETINRLKPLIPGEIVIVTSKKYRELSHLEIERSGFSGTVLCEPVARNTAAAVLYAAVFIQKKYGDVPMVVLPADHFIRDISGFTGVINKGLSLAEDNHLVTIGVKPEYPETGYGYIKGERLIDGAAPVERFVEKPDLKTAEKYVADGNFYWNSGIFVWKTSVIIERFREFLPDMYSGFMKLDRYTFDEIASDYSEMWSLKENIFSAIESISIDHGILEKPGSRMVIPAAFGWADLGSWKAADDILVPDGENNRTQSPENAIFVRSSGCSIFSEGMRIAVVGANNITVVQSGNDILVIDKDSSQDVRTVVDLIRKQKSGA